MRLSCVVALPTDAELLECHHEDAGVFLLTLEANAPADLERFVLARRREWWQPPTQRPWRCLDHLLSFVVRQIEGATSRALFGTADLVASEGEVDQFESRRRMAHGDATSSAASAQGQITRIGEYHGRAITDLYGETHAKDAQNALAAIGLTTRPASTRS